ncbi:MAG: class I SAM-dependent methyltransferase [Pseudomonadota bacterium]
MTVTDRVRWDERYARGDYGNRVQPSTWLERQTQGRRLDGLRVLDVACGAGRNALYLAARGASVTGIDLSKVGLERAADRALQARLPISWVQADLADGWRAVGLAGRFDLIVIVRYLNLPLVTELIDHLTPGGLLLTEVHARADRPVVGPQSDRFRVQPAELWAAGQSAERVAFEQGYFEDTDGRLASLARLAVRHR